MSVLDFKYIVFSFSFIYLPIGSDCLISILIGVEWLQRNYVYYQFLVKYKILETFTTSY